ncbi:MAG: hypothetical protein J0G96_04810 [Flavobacteriia bacterium]|nr:hypothetical protein [Flavobacteriia bacterium]OJX35341.1 MAG: hypothetical protein BGO87_12100 [Flavobacteriia bacterium 40-80]
MNIKKTAIALILIFTLFLQSCALIFTGVKDKVTIKSGYPANAKVYYNGSFMGNAPTSIKVPKKALKEGLSTIKIGADGYLEQEVPLARKVRAGAFILDCLFGFIWLIPDYATGAIYKASPKKIKYDLYFDSEAAEKQKEPSLKVGDTVYFSDNKHVHRKAVVKIIYLNKAVLVFKKKEIIGSLFKKGDEIKEKEIEVEVPFINISRNVTQ